MDGSGAGDDGRAGAHPGAARTKRALDCGGAGFYHYSVGVCALAARENLADLWIDDIGINPGFSAATTSYTARTTDADAEVHAEALYTDATVTIAPADADQEADGHQLALPVGETAVTITVTPGDGSAAKTYSVTVTREAHTTALTGFVLVDASTDADLGAIADGDTVTVTKGVSYGIRAAVDVEAQIGSMVLKLVRPGETDTHTQTENIAPYSLFRRCRGCGARPGIYGGVVHPDRHRV